MRKRSAIKHFVCHTRIPRKEDDDTQNITSGQSTNAWLHALICLHTGCRMGINLHKNALRVWERGRIILRIWSMSNMEIITYFHRIIIGLSLHQYDHVSINFVILYGESSKECCTSLHYCQHHHNHHHDHNHHHHQGFLCFRHCWCGNIICYHIIIASILIIAKVYSVVVMG